MPTEDLSSRAHEKIPGRELSGEALVGLITTIKRPVPIPGMEGEEASDPVAQELLRLSGQAFVEVARYLNGLEITELSLLAKAYSSNAVLLDSGSRVVRLSANEPVRKVDAPYVLQPIAAEKIGSIYVQISKKVQTEGITEADVGNVQANLAAQGYEWDDAGTDNLGRDESGGLVILDGTVKRKKT
ncbi:MAG: hypothetical protein Q7S86_04365 [bacterium]|nr:hypothetical protein [bacterium]